MPDVNQYTVGPKELVELIIKASGIHEGRWALMANLGMGVGNFGPTPDDVAPGVVVSIQSVGITRETAAAPQPPSITVDAAEVNPQPKSSKGPKKGR